MKKRHKHNNYLSMNKKQQFKTISRQDIFIGAGSIIISDSISLMIAGKPQADNSGSDMVPALW